MEISDEVWVASAGETYDMIARNVYGDESYASDILCANPDQCRKMTMTGGEVIKLPVVYVQDDEDEEEEQFGEANAPWKE